MACLDKVHVVDELAEPVPTKKTPSKLGRRGALEKILGRVVHENEELEEDTTALSSLKPNSRPYDNPKSKLEVMKSVLGELGKMEDNDAVAFFHKVMDQFGHYADGVGDNSVQIALLNMHPSDAVGKSVKEDVEKLFEGAEVTADFKEKTTTLFEAALSAAWLFTRRK